MATLNLSGITIPSKTSPPGKDQVNVDAVAYLLLDIFAEAKTVGFQVSDQDFVNLLAKLDTLNTALSTLNSKLDTIKTAIDGVSITVGAPDLTNLIESINSFGVAVLAIADIKGY